MQSLKKQTNPLLDNTLLAVFIFAMTLCLVTLGSISPAPAASPIFFTGTATVSISDLSSESSITQMQVGTRRGVLEILAKAATILGTKDLRYTVISSAQLPGHKVVVAAIVRPYEPVISKRPSEALALMASSAMMH